MDRPASQGTFDGPDGRAALHFERTLTHALAGEPRPHESPRLPGHRPTLNGEYDRRFAIAPERATPPPR